MARLTQERDVYTVLAGDSGYFVARGEWHSPRDAVRGTCRNAWVRMTDAEAQEMVDGAFHPGEWDLFTAEALPASVVARADEAYAQELGTARFLRVRG